MNPLPAGDRGLHASGVSKSFGRHRVLEDLSIEVASGEFLAIMGPSGSGKSTALKCLAGILEIDAGVIEYRGQRLDRLGAEQRAHLRLTDFGFVFQFGQLLNELTALENTALPLLLRGVSRQKAQAEARQWLGTLLIADLADRRVGEFSGGEAQRVEIARAMAGKPSIVFADEPTGALDSTTSRSVLKVMTEVAREHGASIVLVTHDHRVADLADRVVQISDGGISASGQHGMIST